MIGCGRFPRATHVPALRAYPLCRVTAACDPDPTALAAVGAAFELPEAARFASAAELIGSGLVDAVLVSSVSVLHDEHARLALEAGLHTLVDKPLALRTERAIALCERAERRGLLLMAGYNRRFEPGHRYLREQVRTGALGEVRLIATLQRGLALPQQAGGAPAWYRDPAQGGGMLYLRATHMADIVPWIAGAPVTRVSATVRWAADGSGRDRDTLATLELANGALVQVVTLEDDGDANIDEICVYGTAGSVRLSRVPHGGRPVWRPFRMRPDGGPIEDAPLPPAEEMTHNFLDAVRGVAECRAPASEAVAAVRVVEAIIEAGRSGIGVSPIEGGSGSA
jgi:predicted dehydrogenase